MASKITCPDCGEDYNRIINAVCPHCYTQTDVSESLRQKAQRVILSTTQDVSGRQIIEHLGLVFGAGNAAWTVETTAGKANTALEKAEGQLRIEATRLGADAVVGITFSMDSSGGALNRSQAITLLGTAVRLK